MQRRLLDILADPDNPDNWPLELEVFKMEERKRKKLPHPHPNGLLCKFFCYLKKEYLVSNPLGDDEKPLDQDKLEKITNIDTCYNCIKDEIIDGVLYHNKDKELKWFIIDREIPVMFPENLRDVVQERIFHDKYPAEMKKMGIDKPKFSNN
ncbi:MAG: hypothetical protein IH840_06685 [Candidatus Heimdallarchaeota archaeon]|nr:hypothetical protein [Candidatus Heimdallarchaeota archaeon]